MKKKEVFLEVIVMAAMILIIGAITAFSIMLV